MKIKRIHRFLSVRSMIGQLNESNPNRKLQKQCRLYRVRTQNAKAWVDTFSISVNNNICKKFYLTLT